MNKSSDWTISMRICELLINKLSSTITSNAVSVQHKYKSDHKHNTVLCKL